MRLVLPLVTGLAAVAGYMKYPGKVFEFATKAQRRIGGLEPKTLGVGDLTWHYLEGGNASGEPVLLMHGFGANKDNWIFYARSLGSHYRIICPDLPGFGDSDRRADLAYDSASQANRVHDFLVALGIERAHVAGNSMGGMIALQLALLHPATVLSLALLDSAGTSSAEPNEFQVAVESGNNPLAIREPADIDRLVDLAVYKAPRIPKRIKTVVYNDAKLRESFQDMVFEQIATEASQGALDDELASITQPTLIIWGREDEILDVSCTELLHSRIPRSRVEILDKTGHAPMIERPRVSAKLHATFLEDVGNGRI